MASNVKTELLGVTESTSAIEVSSDDDLDDNERVLENNNNVPDPEPIYPERSETPEQPCSICLDVMSNKCNSDSCSHMFCFECLKQWSAVNSSCPLCKKRFRNILHTFNDQGLHETYAVPFTEQDFLNRMFVRPIEFTSLRDATRAFEMSHSFFWDLLRRSEILNPNHSDLNFLEQIRNSNHDLMYGNDIYPEVQPTYGNFPTYGHMLRDQVYRNNMWSQPLPDSTGRFRDCTSNFYRENPAQSHRLHGFIFRDVGIIQGMNHDTHNRGRSVTMIIIGALLRYEIRDASMINFLRPFLLSYTEHFCHELYNFANSPYDLVGYDNNVIFSSNRPIDLSSPQLSRQTLNFEAQSLNHINPIPQHSSPVQVDHSELPEISLSNYGHSIGTIHHDTIVLDSDSDSANIPSEVVTVNDEVIEISSSPESDSEIEIIEQTVHPSFQFNLNLSCRDQPSTSAGIRDTFDRPNNRYNLRRPRVLPLSSNPSGILLNLPQITCHSAVRIGGSVDEYSSSDGETPSFNFVRNKTVYNKRKRRVKKSKTKKRVQNNDSSVYHLSQLRSNFSCSSDDEPQTRPQNRTRL